jgi:hypothetical protein
MLRCAGSQHGIGSVSGQSQTAKDQKKRLRALFFRPHLFAAFCPFFVRFFVRFFVPYKPGTFPNRTHLPMHPLAVR